MLRIAKIALLGARMADSNYLARHLKGELPLPISFWVNGVLLNIIVVIIEWAATKILWTYPPSWILHGTRNIATLIIILWLFAILVSAWSYIGIWRSATKYRGSGGSMMWTLLAKTSIWLASVLLLFEFTTSGGVLIGLLAM
jgi:hypothetical protein